MMKKLLFTLQTSEDSEKENWVDTETKDRKVRSRRTRANAPIRHLIFEKCAEIQTEKEWKQTFDSAASGNFPAKFSFKDGNLKYRSGPKIGLVKIPDDPVEASKIFRDFLGKYGGIYSKIKSGKKTQQENEAGNDWSKMRKNKHREAAISNFITRKKYEYDLNKKEEYDLESVINLGFILGYFNSASITLKNYKIIKLKGLHFDNDVRRFYINEDEVKPKKNSGNSNNSKKVTCDDKWKNLHSRIYNDMNNLKKKKKLADDEIVSVKVNKEFESIEENSDIYN